MSWTSSEQWSGASLGNKAALTLRHLETRPWEAAAPPCPLSPCRSGWCGTPTPYGNSTKSLQTLEKGRFLWYASAGRQPPLAWQEVDTAHAERAAQVVLAKHKNIPKKFVALKVVYLRSPDMLQEPEHLAIMKRYTAHP